MKKMTVTHILCMIDNQNHEIIAIKTNNPLPPNLHVMLKRCYFQFILLRRVLNLKTGQEEEIFKKKKMLRMVKSNYPVLSFHRLRKISHLYSSFVSRR